jgi:hypothetical protein
MPANGEAVFPMLLFITDNTILEKLLTKWEKMGECGIKWE